MTSTGLGVGVHTHPHPHEHSSGHRHTAHGGPVVLDVGGDVGALVLVTDEAWVGAELHISPYGEPDTGRHVAVHPRTFGGRTIHAAVYGDLLAGRYQLWAPDGRPAMTVTITGGAVTEARWTA
jgi:hypothetical protein